MKTCFQIPKRSLSPAKVQITCDKTANERQQTAFAARTRQSRPGKRHRTRMDRTHYG